MEKSRRVLVKQLAVTVAGAVVLVSLLGGCAVLPVSWRSTAPFNPTNGKGRLINANLRAIISAKRGVIGSDGLSKVGRNGKPVTDLVICAEPSPDALQATISTLGIKVSGKEVLNSLFSENATSIALRTQTIQLLRDAYYRLCEAYMNDGIDAIAYDVLQRRFQSQIVALLAVEQLTGAMLAKQNSASPETPQRNGVQAEEEQDENETRAAEKSQEKNKQLKNEKRNSPFLPSSEVVNAVRAITLNAINQDYDAQVCFETMRPRNNVDQFKNDVNHVFVGGDSDKEFDVRRENTINSFTDYCKDLFDQQRELRKARVDLTKAYGSAITKLIAEFTTNEKDIAAQDLALLLDALSQSIPVEPGTAFLEPKFRPGILPSVSSPEEPAFSTDEGITEKELGEIYQ